ncbi:MAG: hypothetical protein HYT80_01980 [Euryarchaeota archaeon]|nr:hypothetical protein [Euryarchaeota archaeon]
MNLRRVVGHVLVGDEAVLLGKDYHGKPGACGQVLGTTVEAYAEGSPKEQDWIDLYASLEAAVPEAVAESRRLSFAERNYWERWNRDVGPWDSHEFTAPHWMRPDPASFDKVAWGSSPDAWAPMPGAPDSIASLIKNSRQEMQVLFRQPMTLNYTSWRRVVEPSEPEGPVAPRDTRYPKLSKARPVAGREVRYAALQDAVGPWFFAWEEKGRQEELHLRAKRGLDEKVALATLNAILTTA